MPNSPVDILFAISDTGGGHRSAAVALSAALDQVSGGTLAWAIDDILRLTDLPLVRGAPEYYDTLSTRWLRLYDATFQLTNATRTVDLLSRLVFMSARRNLIRVLEERRPRLVVSTHPLVNRLVVWARRARRMPCRVITCVTDLVSLHASWGYSSVDLVVAPTDEAFHLLQRRGMRPTQMRRTGFAVHPKFLDYTLDQTATRHQLGLSAERFTILITAGGVGSGRLGELVQAIERACPQHQLLVVTGKNRAVYHELTSRPATPQSHIYGFVDNMEALMAASDMVVTKAGPGTLMEALVMRKPVAVTEAVGMQERGNIDFVLNYELGLFCPTTERIVGAVQELQDAQRYQATVARLADAVPRDGSTAIAQIMMEQLALVDAQEKPAARPRRLFSFPRIARRFTRGRKL
ncbi:MAG: galactosyldiacylglycerol synthase [Candidatus Viridilinea halotolerans]|uniref:Galactosyldiacylglycerol synthase n=1 Tax=Candidatus Viridilinea halotolerans TaxID=2491704 RepID=A0A426U966_9CHLR|nr:MAG: galactosyldiacylglycerol synthase [Candidatus Viridilinea halotolerans]